MLDRNISWWQWLLWGLAFGFGSSLTAGVLRWIGG